MRSPERNTQRTAAAARTYCPPIAITAGAGAGAASAEGLDDGPKWECSWWALPPGTAVVRTPSRATAWLVALAGRCVLRIGEDTLAVGPGDTFVIPAGEGYRLTACGPEPAQLLDVVEAPAA